MFNADGSRERGLRDLEHCHLHHITLSSMQVTAERGQRDLARFHGQQVRGQSTACGIHVWPMLVVCACKGSGMRPHPSPICVLPGLTHGWGGGFNVHWKDLSELLEKCVSAVNHEYQGLLLGEGGMPV